MSTYADVLAAAHDAVRALPGLQKGGGALPYLEGARVRKGQAPEWLPEVDRIPQVVVACREDLAEVVDSEHWENGAVLGYEVYVGLFTEGRVSDELLSYRLARREEIRLALWKPAALGRAGAFWAKYDPAPAVPRKGLPETVAASWQLFTYFAAVKRGSGTGVS